MLYIGKVISLADDYAGERIKVKIKDIDGKTADSNLPYAFPLLPKTIHVKPKIGEAVVVVCMNGDPKQQRFYIGPIISQYQMLVEDPMSTSALKMLDGFGTPPLPSADNIAGAKGSLANDDEVAIYGRGNTDMILGQDDIRIRCASRLLEGKKDVKIGFNRTSHAMIKMKHHAFGKDNLISSYAMKPRWVSGIGGMGNISASQLLSSVNIVGQEINLISTDGTPCVDTANDVDGISDSEIIKFIENGHPLPYGDVLVKFLNVFMRAFVNHTHNYHNMKPVDDFTMAALKKFELNDLLSKNVRIN